MNSEYSINQEQRKQKIVDLIAINEMVSVQELSGFFGVTGATIRNDLRELERANKLIRTHGGAIANGKRSFEDKPDCRLNVELKQALARKTLEYISDGDSVIIDTGTTTLELAKQIAASNRKRLKVLTNDLKIAEILENSKDIEIILAGGSIRKEFHCTVGYQACKFIQQFSVDKAFLATSCLSLKKGFSTPNMQIAEFKEASMSVSNQIFVLCDSTKIGKHAFSCFAGVSDVDTLITNSNIESNSLKELEKTSLKVILA